MLKKLDDMDASEFPMHSGMLSTTCSGGGNKHNAGGCITTSDIFSVEKFLMDRVLQMTTPDEVLEQQEQLEKPIVLVKKRAEVPLDTE